MADWKIFTKNDTVISWVKPGKDRNNPHLSEGRVVSVQPKTYKYRNGKLILPKGYVVEIDKGGYLLSKKSFNKKSTALKYAREYMKKQGGKI